MNRFVAFDVETANGQSSSICSIGIVVMQDLEIVEEFYSLVNPMTYFSSSNAMIHGIRERDVRDAPTFGELWPEISRFFQDALVVAHFAAFDIGCLRASLAAYDIEIPQFSYTCTCVLGRKALPLLFNHKLNTIASHYRFAFLHHNALEDARVCAMIAKNYILEADRFTLEDLANYYKIKTKTMIPMPKPSKIPVSIVEQFDESHPFYQKRICVIGTFKESRLKLWQRLVDVGALVQLEVDDTTDICLLGKTTNSNQQRKAIAYQSIASLQIYSQEECYALFQAKHANVVVPQQKPNLGYLASLRQIVGHRPLLSAGATILVFNDQRELLLQLRSDTHTWGLPGGGMELGESLEEVAHRELREETGLRAGEMQMLQVFSGPEYYFEYPNGDQLYSVIALFVAKQVEGTLAMMDGESLLLQYFAMDQLPELESRAGHLIAWLVAHEELIGA